MKKKCLLVSARKKSRTLSSLCIMLAALSTGFATINAHAMSQNTIRFQGEVNAQTCHVDVNGASGSPVVLLPTVSTNQLANASARAGATSFTVNISGCQAPTAGDQIINLVLAGNNVTPSGNLGNTGSAKNVELQLLDSVGGKKIDLSSGSASVEGMLLTRGSRQRQHL
ncbi:fimbrial protein [Escherichia coli]|uniref:fimbrial protein n=1 Tax=Escherichia coli TaxID=562 RepID=UPI000A5348D0|nr:fimbrial protein [Escherichia coli]MCM4343806.1 type 1 fimbrial protein [Escherichia coli]MCM4358908.1 type 1 fimbrial protein [Escherichia coli]MCV9308633.1 type 1 fimbrial protein [Escherichia coli]MEB7688118.1 type 1 fimbrial protein [Escherichia coli]GDK15050.1 major pilin protein [Escherichia coli]